MSHSNPNSQARNRQASGMRRYFGDLKIRPKLIVLHNLFFLVLSCAIYFSLMPIFEHRVGAARDREISLVTQMFAEERPLPLVPGMEIYEYAQGTSTELGMPREAIEWLDLHPSSTWQDTSRSHYLYRKERASGFYRRLKLPLEFYGNIVTLARWTLFVVLGLTYVLAVLLLELLIMPQYVYRPIRLMLDAEAATQRGDRKNELIDESLILGDEIGQIMRSRNATITELRKQEQKLERAMQALEATVEDLRRKNEQLEMAKRNLEQQDRLASLGLMSASVAHELNTPLAVLQGSIEKLMETAQDPQTRERVSRMMRGVQRIRKISEGLLDFARVRKHESEPVQMRPLIDEAWSLVNIEASGVAFSNLVDEEAVVIGNPDRLIQVFVNLLRNAAHAVQSGGSIVVRSRVATAGDRKLIAISVDDDGPGIPPDVLPDIFDAFVSSRLDARGTGLGLTVAEGIVQQHGGTITASNRPEGGARLEVCLPAGCAGGPTNGA